MGNGLYEFLAFVVMAFVVMAFGATPLLVGCLYETC